MTGSEAWKVSGEELSAAAQAELDEARRIAKAEATVDGLVGKAESFVLPFLESPPSFPSSLPPFPSL